MTRRRTVAYLWLWAHCFRISQGTVSEIRNMEHSGTWKFHITTPNFPDGMLEKCKHLADLLDQCSPGCPWQQHPLNNSCIKALWQSIFLSVHFRIPHLAHLVKMSQLGKHNHQGLRKHGCTVVPTGYVPSGHLRLAFELMVVKRRLAL